jgi:hypothetical protein
MAEASRQALVSEWDTLGALVQSMPTADALDALRQLDLAVPGMEAMQGDLAGAPRAAMGAALASAAARAAVLAHEAGIRLQDFLGIAGLADMVARSGVAAS